MSLHSPSNVSNNSTGSTTGSSGDNCGENAPHHHHHRRSIHELIRHFRRAHWRLSGDSTDQDGTRRRSSLDSPPSREGSFRSRSRSLDDGNNTKAGLAAALARGRAALRRNAALANNSGASGPAGVAQVGECEATYRVYESIVKEGELHT
jgi:hypothetical protein